MKEYIKILKEAIEYNNSEMVDNAEHYTNDEMVFMKGYTQALKDVLDDLNETILDDNSKFYILKKFNLN
jgi:pyruvate-formate lyase